MSIVFKMMNVLIYYSTSIYRMPTVLLSGDAMLNTNRYNLCPLGTYLLVKEIGVNQTIIGMNVSFQL